LAVSGFRGFGLCSFGLHHFGLAVLALTVSGFASTGLSAVTTRSSAWQRLRPRPAFSAGLAAASLSGFAVSLAAVVSFGAHPS